MSNEEDRVGDWLQTAYGRKAWPLDPRPEEMHLDDIAHSLARQCRFAGHVTVDHYSVAEHSVRVSMLVEAMARASVEDAYLVRRIAFAGLMHDAAEAYVVDIPRPFKRFLPGYKQIEERVEAAIAIRFGLLYPLPALVHEADETLLATEARDLMGGQRAGGWRLTAIPMSEHIGPEGTWSAEVAEGRFIEKFYELGGRQ